MKKCEHTILRLVRDGTGNPFHRVYDNCPHKAKFTIKYDNGVKLACQQL